MYVRILIRAIVMLWVIIAYEAIHRPAARGPSILQPRRRAVVQPPDAAAGLDRLLPVVSFEHIGLKDALDRLQRLSRSNILVQWPGLRQEGIAPVTPVDIHLHDVTLRTALNAVLVDAGPSLRFETEDGGLIVVTTRTLGAPRCLDAYDLRHIAAAPPPKPLAPQQNVISTMDVPDFGWPVPAVQVELGAAVNSFLEDDVSGHHERNIHGLWAWGGRLIVLESAENRNRARAIMSGFQAPAQAPQSTERDIEAALNRNLREISFDGVTLERAIGMLQKASNINVIVNWSALSQAGIKRETPVAMRLRNASMRQALIELMGQAKEFDPDLSLKVEGNLLTITSCRFDRRCGVIRVYQVKDIMDAWTARQNIDSPWAPQIKEDAAQRRLIDGITSSNPDLSEGPYSEIRTWSHWLIVNGSPAAHSRVAAYLAGLRQTPATGKAAANRPGDAT
ncbi:MAG: hypothetical protein JWN51_1469 [Phycisphaerales bacterium]|nr:hypothetical protein [Phycisphaerales bacterium]